MKWYRKPRYILLGIVIIVFCFVPVVDMDYLVAVEKQVLEPYTVLEEVEEMGRTLVPNPGVTKENAWEVPMYMWIPEPRIVTKEVTKTRLVTRLVAETQTKRVSMLRYLLR